MKKCILTTVAAFALSSGLVTAEEAEPVIMTLDKGVICDTVDEVISVIELVSGGFPFADAVTSVPGCGIIVGSLDAVVEPLVPYENEYVSVQIGSMEFIDPAIGQQYGWLRVDPKVPATIEQTL